MTRAPNHDFEETVERFRQLAASAIEGHPLDVWPYNSAAPCTDQLGASEFVRFHLDLLHQARVELQGRTVLDVGSGFGFALLVCVLFGAERAEGLEFVDEIAQTVARYLGSMSDDIAARIRVRQGDAADMPYSDCTFDVLLSIEAISHYLDVPAFVAEAARVLKPGGVLIISDFNNGSNPHARRRNEDIWEAFERAPTGTRIHGHTVLQSYQDQRHQAVITTFPELGEKALAIAQNTAGFTFAETLEAARAFLRHAQMPERPYRRGKLAIAPSGMAMERLFKPFTLARELECCGFQAKVYGYWRGASGRWYPRAANRLLTAFSPITLPTAPAFRIVARRL